LTQEERDAVANNLRQIGGALVLAAILSSCTGADIAKHLGGSEELVPAALSSILLGK
jgi:hypothetical protein